jgi:hypothetical protein
METQADLSQPVRLPPPEPSVSVKVRERASRRAVKQAVETAEAEARAHKVAEQLVDWYNQHVGGSVVQYARLGKGRRMHILDTTHIEIPLETGTYECSGVVKNDDGTYARGYKLATLRPLLDNAGLLSQVALAAIQVHDVALCRPLLAMTPVLRAGDLRLEDQGLLDGARQRRKFFAVLLMCRSLFRLLPQVCNRIVIRQIRRQRCCCDALAMDRPQKPRLLAWDDNAPQQGSPTGVPASAP